MRIPLLVLAAPVLLAVPVIVPGAAVLSGSASAQVTIDLRALDPLPLPGQVPYRGPASPPPRPPAPPKPRVATQTPPPAEAAASPTQASPAQATPAQASPATAEQQAPLPIVTPPAADIQPVPPPPVASSAPPPPPVSDTATTRASTVGLTKSLAKELARHGIRSNAVSMGLVRTDNFAEHAGNPDDAERMARIVAQYPLRRLGRPEDVVPTILLLASPLSGWTTGQVLSVNGGYAMP